jgi:hypothetical protein
LFTTGYKRLAERGCEGFLMGVDWWAACQNDITAAAEIRGNMGQCKSEHQDFKKAKERTWDSASLRTETLREIKENMGQRLSRIEKKQRFKERL